MWRDATEERPGEGRLINHSKCHANVSIFLCFAACSMYVYLSVVAQCQVIRSIVLAANKMQQWIITGN